MRELRISEGTTQIEAYEFQGIQDLEVVYLPQTIEKVGKHAFYDCRKLRKVVLYGELFQIEDGAFKNCESLCEVEIFAPDKNTACMKNIVADLTHEISFLIHYEDGDGKILIPGYNYDYEIDINSRVFHEVVYGSGDAYQRCVGKAKLDFSEYDFLFAVAKREELTQTVFRLIEYRLEYPYELEEKDKTKYVSYLKENAKEYIRLCIEENKQKGLRIAAEFGLFEQEDMEAYLELATEKGFLETKAFLMEQRGQFVESIDLDFTF